jgi:hypothetical protein
VLALAGLAATGVMIYLLFHLPLLLSSVGSPAESSSA